MLNDRTVLPDGPSDDGDLNRPNYDRRNEFWRHVCVWVLRVELCFVAGKFELRDAVRSDLRREVDGEGGRKFLFHVSSSA